MPPSVRPLDAVGAAIAVALCLSWGFNQVAVKLAMPEIPPLTQATLRSLGALALILIWARMRGVPMSLRDGSLRPGLLAGALFGLEFVLIYRGLVHTSASRAVVFIYIAPFVVALGARWLLPGERMTALQWSGLALSFAGVGVAIGVPDPSATPDMLAGDLMLLAAGLVWGLTTLVIKTSALGRAPAEMALAYQVAVSAPILAIAALVFGERMTAFPGAAALTWLGYQTFWVVGVTFAIWFAMIQRYSASRLSAFTFLTPLFGVAAGHLVIGEPLSATFAGAVGLVVAGLVLVNRPG